MGGPATLLVDSAPADRAQAELALDAAILRLQELEARYSRYRSDSLVSTINRRAGHGAVTELDPEALALFRLAGRLWEESGGMFDITSGVLREAWDFQRGCVADIGRLEELLPRVGWAQVELSDSGIYLPRTGMQVDLGGLVKEYAADSAIALLRERGLHSALVELAGDVATLGQQATGEPWRVGISDPVNPQQSVRTLKLGGAAVASSGNYARQLNHDGKRYGHLLDPKTGWPVEGPASVTVLSDSCLIAGAVATVACLKQVKEAETWLDDAGLPWLLLDPEHGVRGPLGLPSLASAGAGVGV
jgi:thiamine biosynthesis lipoprotein